MSRLWLVRHAQTDAAPGLCYGSTDVGVPAQATLRAAQAVLSQLPVGVALFNSPLRRCAELARTLVRLRANLHTQTDARLAEMDFGDWEGRLWSDIRRADIDAWTADFADARPGSNGESTRVFMQRVAGAFDDWRASDRDAVWVTHAGVMRAVQLLRRGTQHVERAADWPSTVIGYGECQIVEHPSN